VPRVCTVAAVTRAERDDDHDARQLSTERLDAMEDVEGLGGVVVPTEAVATSQPRRT
jgi:hypothetical protein